MARALAGVVRVSQTLAHLLRLPLADSVSIEPHIRSQLTNFDGDVIQAAESNDNAVVVRLCMLFHLAINFKISV